MKHFKLWGPLRSGTNYLGRVMELNFADIEIHHNEGGWKHGPPQLTTYRDKTIAEIDWPYDGYLLIMKNPFSWAASMYRYNMYPNSWLDGITLANMWNQHAREIFSFSQRSDAMLIKYERLVRYFRSQMVDIHSFFKLDQLPLPFDGYVDEERILLRGGDNMKGEETVSDEERDLSYYLQQRYLNELRSNDRIILRSHIDPYLIHQLGYQEEHEHFPF